MRTPQLLALAVALATSTMANPVPNPAAADEPACTTTMIMGPKWTSGPTRTVWTSTTTATSEVDCGGCNDVTQSTLFLGVGPVVEFTTTTTMAEPSTTTAYACAASAANQ
ncbi:hypothetical protein J3458_005360 [Metarhizium acridum]|uniref:Uncharacterized protein n=1 Tax=Metarhizium acridum (strain CQMa 102) TaxID=655827 RepID=E9EE55_METAQ|nr:uncharacterized protein MAC_08153 [Metarhizium acridum CQMa 102]EFY85768.1 hypothetical protein MAC_08153 [Metarhizium acridum CQMa 102]KAG8417907.1 hypothetical protein J3458_005360 [Metarhizium acridum]